MNSADCLLGKMKTQAVHGSTLGWGTPVFRDSGAYGKEECKMSENKVVHHNPHYALQEVADLERRREGLNRCLHRLPLPRLRLPGQHDLGVEQCACDAGCDGDQFPLSGEDLHHSGLGEFE